GMNEAGRMDTERPDAVQTSGAWHTATAEAVLAGLQTGQHGLSAGEADRRRATHGPNALPQRRRRHPILRFLVQFDNALIYFLLMASAAAWLLGHYIDAAVIVAVVTVNAVVGYLQEDK